jgi:hypothetical protein
MKKRSCAYLLALSGITFSLVAPQPALARNELNKTQILSYKEEGSFGSVRPNEVAKPAATDMTPEKYTRAIDREGFDEEPRGWSSSEKPKYRQIYEEMTKRQRGYGDEEDLGIAIGIGLGFKT